LGWTDGRNVRIDLRWAGDDINRIRALAQELVGLQPDIILASGLAATVALQQETRTIPIVVAIVSDPVAGEIETAIIALGREPGGGLVVMPDAFAQVHRVPIIAAAARNNVPAVYYFSYFAREGGLLSYGPDAVDRYRRAASYVDRILRGEKPGDLPVQLPTKFEMVVNRKTATALGLAIPPSIMLRADEVIE
jgi:putative ABC transport system substrate-binding protein